MDAISSIIFLVIGIAIGFFLSRLTAKTAGDTKSIELELDKNRRELDQYKNQVEEHFASSAQMLEEMAKQYQGFYEHMASRSQSLVEEDSQPQLFADYQEKLELDEPEQAEDASTQPKDYSGEPSGLFNQEPRKAS